MAAHHPFSAKTGDLSNRRVFLTVFLGRHNPVLARASAVPSSSISTVKLEPCLHTPMGEVRANLACNDRQSCCQSTETRQETGARGQQRAGKRLADGVDGPSSTAGTAPPDRLQTSPQTPLLPGHTLCPATGGTSACTPLP